MSLITIIVHSASNLPEKLGLLKSCNPSVKLYVGNSIWESKRHDKPGANCSWEEQASFSWDGNVSLAIDMMSKDNCFAKAFVNLNDYIGRQPRFSGAIQLKPEKGCDTRPSLQLTIMRNNSGPAGGPGFHQPPPPHGGPGFGCPQPGPGFGQPQPGPGFGHPQPGPGFGCPQPGYGHPQPGRPGPGYGHRR